MTGAILITIDPESFVGSERSEIIGNTVLSDLANAAVGDLAASELIRRDHIGTLMLAGRVQHPTLSDIEIVVIRYDGGAGNQLFIAADGAAPDGIDLVNDAIANNDPSLRSDLQRAIDLWCEDPDLLGGSLIASPADPYRRSRPTIE